MSSSKVANFFHSQAAPGIILGLSAIFALIFVNSPLQHYYHQFLETHLSLHVGHFHIEQHLLHFINDALMAVFFLLIGLEIKREMLEGELSSLKQIILPAIAAVGGMLVPALVYIAFNFSDPQAINGWAIPAATDIAFALGVISLFGKRVPLSLKVFLVALAIFDDLGAIVIIALFYSSEISVSALTYSACTLGVLFTLNRVGVKKLSPYLLIGLALWYFVLESGIHATLAGVALAFMIPSRDKLGNSPMKHLEHSMHSWVNFGILPVFGFANAGVSLQGVGVSTFTNPVALGVFAGLFIGKQVGIFSFTYLAVKTGIAKMPRNASWLTLYGVSMLGGIGFTMSLFVGALAFSNPEYLTFTRIGILLGSLFSGVGGYALINYSIRDNKSVEDAVSEGAKNGLRILLAEDSLVSQSAIAAILEQRGHIVTVGDSGERLLELFQVEDFDLILMDIQTPITEAYEALEQIRLREQEHLPIFALSEEKPENLNRHIDDFVAKPLNEEELRDRYKDFQ